MRTETASVYLGFNCSSDTGFLLEDLGGSLYYLKGWDSPYSSLQLLRSIYEDRNITYRHEG